MMLRDLTGKSCHNLKEPEVEILKIIENKSTYTLCQVGGSLEQYHYRQSSFLLKAEAQVVSNHI